MESEARQNPLSKVETIEQLQTTIDKLAIIIEQLNSRSVVDFPASNSVEALMTSIEELEKAISTLPQETVAPKSQVTPTSNVVEAETPEVTPIPSQEQPASSAPKTRESETPQKTLTKSATKASRKSTKPKKKKNWIAIAIVALIVAIIPISLKYLAPRINQQLLSDNAAEIVAKDIIEEPSVIATKLADNNLPKNLEQPVLPEATESAEELAVSEIINQQAADITVSEPQKTIEEIAEVATTDLITEEITESEVEKSLGEETNESILTSTASLETSLSNNKEESIIASDASESEAIAQLETKKISEYPSNLKQAKDDEIETIDEKLDETVALEIDNIPEAEPKILVPENLVASEATETLEIQTLIQDVKLTPEQNLIAALSKKVLQLSQDFQEDIILSIEPNIANNILIVKITDDWYQLENAEQNAIVTDMFARSQKLEFRKLEIKDQNNNLVARSPVVGQKMIIFRHN